MKNLRDQMLDQIDEIAALKQGLRVAAAELAEAAEDIGDWGSYASEYFQGKHRLGDDLLRYRSASRAALALCGDAPDA